ncbi:MAG: hypothetical protein AUI83_03510 [Armatimonadetes bacterium 13_1_40CM_3_65_7]|nr:MAG: hypothetical protein AUI83_03510 [Armatimonadetes bacterium 13_1_40CM_3_65_7]
MGQIQELLPAAGVLRSLVRLEMNGTPPLETAVVAVVPRYPGAADSTYVGFIIAYDEWRRRPERVYVQPLPGPIPLSPDAVVRMEPARRASSASCTDVFESLMMRLRPEYSLASRLRRPASPGATGLMPA